MADDPTRLKLRRPDDWHVHLRDGAMLEAVAPWTARQFARAIVMPNLDPPVTTLDAAEAYRRRILAALPAGTRFTPLMTCYLTDEADPRELAEGHERGIWAAAKLYPAHATTNSAHGVTDIAQHPAGARGDAADRHAAARSTARSPIRRSTSSTGRRSSSTASSRRWSRDFPALKTVFEHITTAEAADFVLASGPNVAATVTPAPSPDQPQRDVRGRDPAACLLPAGGEARGGTGWRSAARRPRARPNSSSAPTAPRMRSSAKQSACGCAGIFNAPFALESYATAFEEEGALDRLEAFASEHGPRFYGLPLNEGTVTLERVEVAVPESVAAGGSALVPFHAGETLRWRFVA